MDEKVIDYSRIKLPAVLFVKYLANFSKHFINDCLRYNLKYKIKLKNSILYNYSLNSLTSNAVTHGDDKNHQ